MENTLISIIVPVYNTERYLSLCIKSLLAQTYTNLEIILVNDGSKDSSLDICRKFEKTDDRIRVIDKSNTGVSDTRNTGIDVAKGDYIMFCDSDDCVASEWCKRLIEAQSDDNLTMCRYQTVASEEMTTALLEREIVQNDEEMKIIDRRDFIFWRDRGFFSPVNKIYSKEIVQKHNIRFPVEISLGEDLAFVLAYLKAVGGEICVIPDSLYYYRTNDTNSLSRRAPMVEQCNYFYKMLTTAMHDLNVKNTLAWQCRDDIVIQDFEKRLIKIVQDRELSFLKKYVLLRQAMDSEAYCVCCGKASISPNRIYQWMLSKRKALFLLFYFIIRGRSSE